MDRIFSLCLSCCYVSQPSNAYINDMLSHYKGIFPEISYKTVEAAAPILNGTFNLLLVLHIIWAFYCLKSESQSTSLC